MMNQLRRWCISLLTLTSLSFQRLKLKMKQPFIVLLCLFVFAVFISSVKVVECGKHGAIVKCVPSAKYTTLLGIDGGGLRGIISAVVLVELEDSIKRHIFTERPQLMPEDASFQSIDDFEISLADYIDYFAGNSIGALLSLYLASKGGNGQASEFLNQRRIQETYGEIAPTSAKGLIVIFYEFSEIVFPQDRVLANIGTNPADPGVLSALLSNSTGIHELSDTMLGDIKLSELSTSCLLLTYDIIRRSEILVVYDQVTSPPKYGFTRQVRRNTPRRRNETFTRDLVGQYGVDFLASDIGIGSSALPPFLPAREANSTTKPMERLLLVDGYLFLADPVFPALVHIANSTGDTSFSRVAVLSLGAGLSLQDPESIANGGSEQWDQTGNRVYFAANMQTAILSKQISFLFSANPEIKPGQFLRIDAVGEPGTERSRLLGLSIVSSILPQLEAIGRETAQTFRPSIDSFVSHFIFPDGSD